MKCLAEEGDDMVIVESMGILRVEEKRCEGGDASNMKGNQQVQWRCSKIGTANQDNQSGVVLGEHRSRFTGHAVSVSQPRQSKEKYFLAPVPLE